MPGTGGQWGLALPASPSASAASLTRVGRALPSLSLSTPEVFQPWWHRWLVSRAAVGITPGHSQASLPQTEPVDDKCTQR